MVLMGYSGVWGKLIYEINLKLKILCQTPFQNTIANAGGGGGVLLCIYIYVLNFNNLNNYVE
jgi:hypothetical protein